MKKFFSIFCALAIVLSASAVPSKQLRAGKIGKEDLAKQLIDKAPVKKVPTAKFAPAKKAETYNVVITSCVGTNWGTDVQYIMDDEEGLFEFAFDILIPSTQEDVNLGQTYTLDEMDLDYTWGGNPTTQEYFPDFSAVSFLKTVDSLGLVNVTVNVTDVEGNIYNLVYQEEPLPVATDTISVVYPAEEVTLTDLVSTQGLFQFVGKNANGAAYAAFSSDTIEGVYSAEDLLLEYTGLYFYGADTTIVDVLAGEAVVTFANDTFHLDAYYLGNDARCYHVQMAYYQEPFVPTGDTIAVNVTEPMKYTYYASGGDWWFRGANDAYEVKIDVVNNDSTSPAGVYAKSDALSSYTYLTRKADTTKLSLMDLQAEVTVTDKRINLVADMLCDDGNVYHITMFYAIPEALYFDTIVADNMEIEELTIYGMVFGYTVTANDSVYAVSLSLSSDQDGTYAASGSITNIATEESSSIYSGNIVLVTDSTGARGISGDVLCMNNTLYTLALAYTVPEATRVDTIIGAGRLIYYADNGVWQMTGVNEAMSKVVIITMNAASADSIEGVYTNAQSYGKYYNYVTEINGADTAIYVAVEQTLSVSLLNDSIASVTGIMLAKEYEGTEVVEYTYSFTCLYAINGGGEEEGNEYDAKTGFTHIFPEYTLEDKYLAQYGVIIVSANDAMDDSYISIEFNMPEGATALNAGVYAVNATYDAGTVSACDLDLNEGSIYGSFAGTVTPQGISVPFWMFAGGNVTVHENGIIEVSAVNTWGAQINCRLGSFPEAINNTIVTDDAVKAIRNGQFIIIKNGVEYNAQGAVIK